MLALLLDAALSGQDLSNVCADLLRAYDLSGSYTVARPAISPFNQEQGTAGIAGASGRFLHVAITPCREPRFPTRKAAGPIKRTMVSTRDRAQNWTQEEILRIQREGDAKQMARFHSAMARVERGEAKWPSVSTARYNEPCEIYKILQVCRPATRARPHVHFDQRANKFAGHRRRINHKGTPNVIIGIKRDAMRRNA